MGLIQRSDRRRSALNRAEQRLRFSAKAIMLLAKGKGGVGSRSILRNQQLISKVSSVGGVRRRRYLCSACALTVAHAVLGLSVTHPPNNVFFPAKPLIVAGMRSLCSALLPFVSRSLFNATALLPTNSSPRPSEYQTVLYRDCRPAAGATQVYAWRYCATEPAL